MANLAFAVGGTLALLLLEGCVYAGQPVISVRVDAPHPTNSVQRAIWAASWSPVPDDCAHITPMIVLGGVFDPFGDSTPTLSPERAAAASRSRPDGKAALRWDRYSRSLFARDAARVKSGGDAAVVDFWQTNSIDATRAEWTAWLRRFRAAGGTLDYLIGDCEEWSIYRSWSLGQSQVDRIASSPRALAASEGAPSLREILGDARVSRVTDYRGADDYLAWNRAVGRITAGALDAAVWRPASQVYPALRGSNFCGMRMLDRPAPDLNGHPQPSDNRVGTANSIGGYGRIEQVASAWFIDPMDPTRLSKQGTRRLAVSPWTSLLLDVQTARACRRTEPSVPLQPWIALASWKGIGRSKVAYPDDPLYYDEMIRHLALHGTEVFLLWNPPASTQLGITEEDRTAGARRLDRILAELSAASIGVVAHTITNAPLAFEADFILTSARLDSGDLVHRVTLAPGIDAVRDAATGRMCGADPGTRGFWIRTARDGAMPRFESVRPNEDSAHGRQDAAGSRGAALALGSAAYSSGSNPYSSYESDSSPNPPSSSPSSGPRLDSRIVALASPRMK